MATATPGAPYRRRFRFRPGAFFSYVALVILGAAMAFPFLWMILTAFKSIREIFGLSFWPENWTLANFQEVLFQTEFPRWFLNSFVVASITTISVLFFCALVGYTLARMRFKGKEIVFVLILSTMMIPTEMLVIPWFVMSAEYGWTNTYWGIMFPGLITGFGVFLLRQFFSTLPVDLFDAGRLDGLSEWGLFWRVGLPLVGPGLSALGIFTFIGNWNAFLWPLVVISDRSMRTIPVGTALFSGEAATAYNLIMAASAMAIIPVLIVFIIFQKQIVEGVVLTGVKG